MTATANREFELRALKVGDRVTVTSQRADEIRKWCGSAPGFSNGPRHAPNAVIFQPIE